MRNSRELLHYIFRIGWGIIIILAFIYLRFWWTIVSLIVSSALAPSIEMIFYSPFRKTLQNKLKIAGFVAGAGEFVATLLIFLFLQYKFTPPSCLFGFLILLYTSNQLSRTFRNPDKPMDWFELNSVIGFLFSVGIYYIFHLL